MLAAGGAALLEGPLLVALYTYRLVSAVTPVSCRYTPSCSRYAITAVRRHGPLAGLWLACGRLLRCHPWGGFGDDPVPERVAGPAAWLRPPARRCAGCHRH